MLSMKSKHDSAHNKERVKSHSQFKLGFMQLAAGGSAGFVEICLMHPLDLIKTRFQIQTRNEAGKYNSMAQCVRIMYRTEGLLSFYKGILPPILAETPKRATKFFTFEQYKRMFSYGDRVPTSMVLPMAGLFSGMTEAVVVNPFEVVKVKQQTEKGLYVKQVNAYATAREIIKKNGIGLQGINKGLTATLLRHGIWNMCYFGFYHNVKALAMRNGENPSVPQRLLIGFLAGSLASCVNIPVDVAKSRIQGPQPSSAIKYKSTWQTLTLVYREEGAMALYRGLLPKIMRLGPGGAIMLIVYEHVMEFLKDVL